MQGNVGKFSPEYRVNFVDHCLAFGLVHFHSNLIPQNINSGIPVTTEIPAAQFPLRVWL